MKKIFLVMILCMGMFIPHNTSAYEGQMDSTGAVEVTYTPSRLSITAPVETVVKPPKTDDSHQITGYLLGISGSLLILLLVIYNREKENEEKDIS